MADDNQLNENTEVWSCSDCGADVSENDKVCPKCGADLNEPIEVLEEENVKSPVSFNKDFNSTVRTLDAKRHYKTAYTLAKIVEVISWFILLGGIIAGIAVASKSPALGVPVILLSVVFGLLLVFSSQQTLIFIDTENNTRKSANEAAKTNAMLADTLGTIASNLNKIVKNTGAEK